MNDIPLNNDVPLITTVDDNLTVRCYEYKEHLVIEAVGMVTQHTVDILAGALLPSVDNAAVPVIVDLRQVKLLDRSGLDLLIDASKRIRSRAVRCIPHVIVEPGQQPDQVLRAGSFDKIVSITDGLSEEASQ